eukprot:220812-Pleurochrysis_carterae.AAC.1
MLKTGANLGATTFLSSLVRLMRNDELPREKRRLGGSENVSFVMHALHATLVQRGAFDEIVWARLPPDHSHDAIDRFFS